MTDTTATESVTGVGQDKADKIAKLLAQAENVAGTPEADVFFARATELMIKYEIDEAMIAAARGKNAPEQIVEDTIPYTGIFKETLMMIGFGVVRAHGCKAFYSKVDYPTSGPKRVELHVFGYESDVRTIKMLDTSLQIQCATALSNWWKSAGGEYSYSKGASYKAKREFISAFAQAVTNRMVASFRAARAEAAKSEAARTNTSVADATESVALVLRSRTESVKDWYDTRYGRSTRTVTRRTQSGGFNARSAGHLAGTQANTGGTTLGGNRKSIGG